MKRAGTFGWAVTRYRRSIAMAVSGWMFLSLVLAFWPCCLTVADEHPPADSVVVNDHDHGNVPPATEDPCRTWLDTADAALNTSPDVLLSDFELKIAYALHVGAHDFSHVPLRVRGGKVYNPSPPVLPLYLRVQHLLI